MSDNDKCKWCRSDKTTGVDWYCTTYECGSTITNEAKLESRSNTCMGNQIAQLTAERDELREVVGTLIEAEWMVTYDWTDPDTRKRLMDMSAKSIGYKDNEDFFVQKGTDAKAEQAKEKDE